MRPVADDDVVRDQAVLEVLDGDAGGVVVVDAIAGDPGLRGAVERDAVPRRVAHVGVLDGDVP